MQPVTGTGNGPIDFQVPDGDPIETPRQAPVTTKITADPEQAAALELCRTTPFNNLSGTAGVGKTYVARQLARDKGTMLAATTGIAAVNLGEGTTINALLKYFDTASLRDAFLSGIVQSRLRALRRVGLRRIVLDEKSMLNGEQLTYIARAIDDVNNAKSMEAIGDDGYEDDSPSNEVPQIGLTLVGDFGQLPPVPDKDKITQKNLPVQFAFDSPEWARFAAHTAKLEKVMRQDAVDFIKALHAVRKADIQQALTFFHAGRFQNLTDDNFNGTTIFAKNDAVERFNQLRLDQLKTPEMRFQSVRTGTQRGDWKLIPDVLVLKEGALVMILANFRVYEDEEDSTGKLIYANGDLGTVLSADEGGAGWSVRLQRNGQVVRVQPIIRQNTIPLEPGRKKELIEQFGLDGAAAKIDGKHEIIGTITYMPLRCAYGCTVHKTQGLTLDNVQVNLRDPFFKQPGMLFVALSRARTAEGLRIVGDQRGFLERCRIEPRVQPWL